jgi:hypothetical protein
VPQAGIYYRLLEEEEYLPFGVNERQRELQRSKGFELHEFKVEDFKRGSKQKSSSLRPICFKFYEYLAK